MDPSLALADRELLMDLSLRHLNYTVRRTIQSANHICELCTLRHSHLWITNIRKKNPESSKRRNLNLLHINNYSHSIDFVFRTIYTELMWY